MSDKNSKLELQIIAMRASLNMLSGLCKAEDAPGWMSHEIGRITEQCRVLLSKMDSGVAEVEVLAKPFSPDFIAGSLALGEGNFSVFEVNQPPTHHGVGIVSKNGSINVVAYVETENQANGLHGLLKRTFESGKVAQGVSNAVSVASSDV